MRILILLIFTYCFSSFAQSDLQNLRSASELICYNKETYFCKAYKFYENKFYDSCYVYSNKALSTGSLNAEQKDILHYLKGISAINKSLYKKALESMSLISENGKYKGIKNSQLGRVYLYLRDYEKAIKHYKVWESLNKKDVENDRDIIHNIGLTYLHIKDFELSKKYFEKELSLIEKKDTFSLIRTKINTANAYYVQYKDDIAIPLFLEAYNLSNEFSDYNLKRDASRNMAVVERNRKNYKESVKYYEEYIKWKDSIWNRDNIVGLVEKDKQIAVAQKQQEITLQEEEIKRQNLVQNGLLAGASGLVIFIGFLGFLYRKLKKQNELITQQKEDLNIANKTKDYLFSVVSHDLRSPMNTIKSQHVDLKNYIEANDLEGIKKTNDAAILVTESTSHLLNNVLHWSLEQSNQLVFDTNEYALRPLVQHVLHDYATLVDARGITVETEIENVLAKLDKESIKIVLRNLLDNALKYMGDKGKITLRTGAISDNEAFISIEDTGQGISPEKLKKINELKDLTIDKIDRSKGVGLGLLLCQTLVKKNDGSITFESDEGKGTKITILLPRVAE